MLSARHAGASLLSVAEAHLVVAYTPAAARAWFERRAPGFTLLPQTGEGLGEGLHRALSVCLARGHRALFAIGSDSPTLPADYLREALACLARPDVDVVLDPAEDGGYYAVGLKSPQVALFRGIAMSTSHVLSDTLARAADLGLHAALLPPWYDVDTTADPSAWRMT